MGKFEVGDIVEVDYYNPNSRYIVTDVRVDGWLVVTWLKPDGSEVPQDGEHLGTGWRKVGHENRKASKEYMELFE